MNSHWIVLVLVLVCASGLDKQVYRGSDSVNSHSFTQQTFGPSVRVGGQIKQFRYEDKAKDFRRLNGEARKVRPYQVHEDGDFSGENFDGNGALKDQGLSSKDSRFGARNVIRKDFRRGRFETEFEDLKSFDKSIPKNTQHWEQTEPKQQQHHELIYPPNQGPPKAYQFTQTYEDFTQLKPQKLEQNYQKIKFPESSPTKSRLEYLHDQRYQALQESLNLQKFPSDSHRYTVHSFHGLYQSHGSGFKKVKSSLLPHSEDDVEEKARFLCLTLGICSQVYPSSSKISLATVFEWKQLEFDYLTPAAKQADLDSGYYIPMIPAPIDMDLVYNNVSGNKVYVTIPRFQVGSPVTLGIITQRKLNGDPIIAPYPNWSWHENPKSCKANRLISVYRIKIDACGRLWALDTGKYGDSQTCPAQLIAFDVNTNEVLIRFEIPSSLLESRSILVTPEVDIRDGNCQNTFVYIADCQTYSIIVYDVKNNRSWKATDKTMYPEPQFGTFNIQGEQFDLMDGILSLALEPYVPGKDRKLFYSSLSAGTQNWVYTSYLRNETRFEHNPESSPEVFNSFPTLRPSQAGPMAIDKNSVGFFGLMTQTSINCWNTKNSDYGKYIGYVARDTVRFQFASGAKIIENNNRMQELWVLTSRFQRVATGTLTNTEVNFRISGGKVDDLIVGTGCKQPVSSFRGYNGGPTRGYGLRPFNSLDADSGLSLPLEGGAL